MNAGILNVLAFLLAAVPISLCDIRERRIPNGLLFPGLLLALWCASRSDGRRVLDVFLAAALGFTVFWCLWHFSRGRMGMGDVKYASLVGAFTGVGGLCAAVFIASFAGLLFAAVLIAVDRKNVKAKIPFAPFLSIGCTAALIADAVHWPGFLAGGTP
jgi:leader peptidase (prepilin peptidase) / N-methyltransferase